MSNNSSIALQSLPQRNQIIEEHRAVILEMRRIEREIEKLLRENGSRWKELETERNVLYARIEPLVGKYWDWIQPVKLSRCPFCVSDLLRLFDPVDFNGFWWMDRTQRPKAEPKSCEHFQLLQGAVNLNGRPFLETLFECHPGPGSPFVIPRVLELPTMQAVISSIPMHCGYTAYLIAYFSEVPPPSKSLTQSWARKQYHFRLPDGRAGWDVIEDRYEHDLASWITKGKVKFLTEGLC